MDMIKGFLLGTPWWVYVLLIVLIQAGVRASKTCVVPVSKMLILPVVFAFLSLDTLLTQFPLDKFTVSIYAAATVVAIIAGWVYVYRQKIEVNREHWLLQIPGTWTTLVLVLVIFASKYYFGYRMSMDPSIVKSTGFDVAWLLVSGLCTGYIVGRAIGYFYKLYTQESIALKKPA